MPPVALPGTAGGTVRIDALGAGRTVLYVCPLTGRPGIDLPEGRDAIPGARGCTTEARDFHDHRQELRGRAPSGSSACPARTPRTSARSSNGSGCRSRCCPTPRFRNGTVAQAFCPVFPPNEHARQVLAWLRDNPVRRTAGQEARAS
ncbi:hypothetical protein ACF08N_14635 [Streptomyces sp. NPDC015127]|uniref:hypothetical protein n=1 Tax=Streptomyces sp. NPDC015127 TaxID=3364939 RepID=UPI0036FC1D9A